MIKLRKAIFLLLICLIFVFIAYSKKDIQKKDVYEAKIEEDKNYEIALTYSNGRIVFNTNEIPEINEYLKDFTVPKLEIDKMKLNYITQIEDNKYFILKYGGAVKLRNYVLIKENHGDITSVSLSKASIYQDHELSPNNKYVSFVFGRNEGNTVIKHDIIIINLSNMKKCMLKTDNKQAFKPFYWFIDNLEWIDNKIIEICIPDLKDFDFNSLEKWILSENKKVHKVRFLLY